MSRETPQTMPRQIPRAIRAEDRRHAGVRARRAGYLYVAVVFTAMAVTTMGLVVVSTASLRMRSASDTSERVLAHALAESAIEEAVLQLRLDGQWRSAYDHGVEYPELPRRLGQGVYTWMLLDDDGDLGDDDSDSVRVVGIGRAGRSTVAESVRLLPSGRPLTSLASAVHCDENVSLGHFVELETDQRVSSNGHISAVGFLTRLDGDAEAVGSIEGSISGSRHEGADPRRMPGSSVFDYYLDNGTAIAIDSLPSNGGKRWIVNRVLGPQSNPFGDVNPEGIYVIDCGGEEVEIRNSRIFGTIVLLHPGAGSSLQGSLRWDPAVRNYPALLVHGDLEVRIDRARLSESLTLTNFNPPGTPYRDRSDHDILDDYRSDIRGLVYASGRLFVSQYLRVSEFRGVTICGGMQVEGNCEFDFRQTFWDDPPPGFSSGNPMVISPGSRQRETLGEGE